MNKNLNLIIAAVFMMGFLMFWETFVMSRYGSRPTKTVASRTAPSTLEPATPPPVMSRPSLSETRTPAIEKETLTILEADKTKVSILSRGARVASWQIHEKNHWTELVVPEKHRQFSPLETFREVNFSAEKISENHAVFIGLLPNGLSLKKEIQLLATPPFHSISLIFSNPTQNSQSLQMFIPLGNGVDKHDVNLAYDEKNQSAVQAETRALGLAARIKSWKPGFVFSRNIDLIDNDTFQWVGLDNHHFLSALIPVEGLITGLKVVADRIHPPLVAVPINIELGAGETRQLRFHYYSGPKSYDDLKKFGKGLDQAVDFGFFGVIAKILLKSLNFFRALTGNYGWAIILLTFCIQLLVFPLTRKNLQHSAKMRELQPHIKKLQEQYKSDPKRLQVETFNFYKKNGMKFMGMEGCFPMLLQIPVFFAFYSTLNVAYELRGAPWIFWIKDLGVYDPYFVLPIIMGAGMFLQQKMTAVVADPAQAKVMMFMPIMFTIMFHKLPAGLVLYWCVNSLTTISLQLLLGVHKSPSPETTA
ncbi:MAG: Membrane protein insertase YidC [Elusimicrobia bacterium]|nr:Membrane protein insertase YidC [Elusimicrobiota bacterium]